MFSAWQYRIAKPPRIRKGQKASSGCQERQVFSASIAEIFSAAGGDVPAGPPATRAGYG
ncbi:hypothetical protein ASAP_1346 [Asaia bogorensis]|uniref:Uncharacterized protein n=1 Tax=Asaia bogorensis TaxID=91915 RepID=A0A060QJH3_9PROT|nr:hypothetical protein ASAP_1346 [Asaia bogorensis]